MITQTALSYLHIVLSLDIVQANWDMVALFLEIAGFFIFLLYSAFLPCASPMRLCGKCHAVITGPTWRQFNRARSHFLTSPADQEADERKGRIY